MQTTDVIPSLAKLSSAQTKKTYLRHGCPEPLFGVTVADMKALIKKVIDKGRHGVKRKTIKC